MISSAIDMHLETLAGHIFDDDKLVTYKWLSKELGLHVNLAKQILWQFWKEHSKRKDVLATFTLMGYLVDDVYRVEVVKESDLESARRKFRKLDAEHLYSLQRALPDLESLALTGPGDFRQAAVACKEIAPRKEGELIQLRWGSRISDERTAGGSNKKSANPGPNSISADPKSKTVKNTIGDIFGKGKPSKSPNLDFPKDAARGQKRRGSSDREVISSKKQKQKFDDDYRSSGESNPDEEDGLEMAFEGANPAEDIAVASSPPKYKIENGKRKVRITIDKTSTDENGYFVTKKEYVYESCSDTEESNAPKVEAPKPQASAKSNRKQASLLNFFKKS